MCIKTRINTCGPLTGWNYVKTKSVFSGFPIAKLTVSSEISRTLVTVTERNAKAPIKLIYPF